jgi:hypothetical protein
MQRILDALKAKLHEQADDQGEDQGDGRVG